MLTHKQETYCQGIIDGLTQSEAYRRAYDAENMSDAVISVKASELMRDGNITVRLNELRARLEELQILPRVTRLKVLAEIVTRNVRKDAKLRARDNDVIAAIKAYGEMVGDNAPQKISVEHSGETNKKVTFEIIDSENPANKTTE